MMIIEIQEMKVPVRIGVHSWEKERPTELTMHISLEVKETEAMISDNVYDALDYTKIYSQIEKIINHKHYDLLEHLAWCINKKLLSNHLVEKVTTRIQKPRVVPNTEHIQITLTESKGALNKN